MWEHDPSDVEEDVNGLVDLCRETRDRFWRTNIETVEASSEGLQWLAYLNVAGVDFVTLSSPKLVEA